MFGKLKDTMASAAQAASEKLDSASALKDKAESLATDLKSRTPDMDDVRQLLGLLDYVPGVDKQELTNELLNSSLAVLQMGSMSILFTHDGKAFSAEALKLDKIDVTAANEAAGEQKYSKTLISESTDPEKPSIHLVTNDAYVAEVGTDVLTKHLLSNLIVAAIMFPIESLPLIGKPVAFILEPPCELIVDFLVNRTYDQFKAAEKAGLEDKTPATQPQPPAKPQDFNGPV